MLDKLSKAVQAALPPELKDDIKSNVDAVVRSNFEKLNLVSREQLDIQEKVLRRTREKLKELEAKISELETRLENSEKEV